MRLGRLILTRRGVDLGQPFTPPIVEGVGPPIGLMNRAITLIRRTETGTTDDYGNPIPTEITENILAEFQQIRRDEAPLVGEISETLWLLFLPAGTAIDTSDAAVVDGKLYEMVGAPWRARNPLTHTESHVECTLRRVAGAEDPG